jgi:RNA polymerase sigma factor (TIGR02999 family)
MFPGLAHDGTGMTLPEPTDITRLLHALESGDPGAADELAPLVYEQLHQLAVRALSHEQVGHTLQPTALVHEAFLLLAGQRSANWQDRTHFFAMAARLMRRILVDHARKRLATKRQGGVRVTLDDSLVSGDDDVERNLDVIAVEEALTRLESLDERPARVVELRFFAGLNVEETAKALNISPASVVRDWAFAKAFLRRELAAGEAGA